MEETVSGALSRRPSGGSGAFAAPARMTVKDKKNKKMQKEAVQALSFPQIRSGKGFPSLTQLRIMGRV